jgi:hypothetical protein
MTRPATLFLSLAATLIAPVISSCTVHTHEPVSVPPPPPPGPIELFEIEPNGSYLWPQPIGSVAAGDWFVIYGDIQELGPDLFDGFAFQSAEPCDVVFRLTGDVPWSDLDVCLYDPYTGAKVAIYQSPWNPEVGSFSVFAPWVDFQLVVSSFCGDTSYSLEIEVVPLGWSDGEALGAIAPHVAEGFEALGAKTGGVDWGLYDGDRERGEQGADYRLPLWGDLAPMRDDDRLDDRR